MANLAMTEVVEEADEVADEVRDGVGGGAEGGVGVTVATEVGGDGAEAGGGEGGHLVAPGVPRLREAVEEEHQVGALPLLRHVHPYPVRPYPAVAHLVLERHRQHPRATTRRCPRCCERERERRQMKLNFVGDGGRR